MLIPILVSSWAISGIIRAVAKVECTSAIPSQWHGSCMVITAGMTWWIYSDAPSRPLVWVINYLLTTKCCFLSLFLLSSVLVWHWTKSFKSKDLVLKQYIYNIKCILNVLNMFCSLKVCLFYSLFSSLRRPTWSQNAAVSSHENPLEWFPAST